MKTKDYNYSKLKHELYEQKNRGKKQVIRKLKPDEANYLSTIFIVTPYIYEIQLHFDLGFNPKFGSHPGIIKELFYSNYVNHKYTVYKTLSKNQLEACKRYGLYLKPYKYKIRFV